MKLRQLEIFRAVYLSGSISGASHSLKISGPAVSRMISFLESKLRYALFLRTNSGLLPTFEAHHLFKASNQLFEKVGHFHSLAKTLQSGAGRQLRVGCSSSAMLKLVPSAICLFVEKYASTSVSVNLVHADELVDQVLSSELDLGVSTLVVNHPDLLLHELPATKLVCAFKKGHPLSRTSILSEPLGLTEIASYRRVRFSSPSNQIQHIEQELQALEKADQPCVSVRLSLAALAMVRASDYVCVIDELAVNDFGCNDIESRPIQGLPEFKLSVVSLNGSLNLNVVQQFYACLKACLTHG
jgi:DNA-binding transcriptional LysR family regulator